MCIAKSVGNRGANVRQDVKLVQILLNGNAHRFDLSVPLKEDGAIGTKTKSAISAFQSMVMRNANPTSRIEPHDETLQELVQGLESGVSLDRVCGVMIHTPRSMVSIYHPSLQQDMASNGISAPLRIAHFLAQIGHESAGFVFTEELASGEAYEGRRDLGNTEPGDGKKFKGRGLIQLTGRHNYQRFGDFVGRDLMSDEGAKIVATDARLAVLAAIWFWTTHDLNALADADDVSAVTREINGGLNGLADRKDYLQRAKFFVGI